MKILSIQKLQICKNKNDIYAKEWLQKRNEFRQKCQKMATLVEYAQSPMTASLERVF